MKLFLLLSFLCSPFTFLDANEESLRLVHVFFRHGARTPELKDVYPTHEYTLETFLPMGWGQLTTGGKRLAFKLGQLLRQRYDRFLGNIYTSDAVETVSTDYDRTKMTALLVLAGLFPPSPAQRWEDSLAWQPIPYHYDKDQYDYSLRRPFNYCPTYTQELEKVMSSAEAQNDLKVHANLLQYIEQNTKKPMKKLSDVFSIYQILNAEETMNLPLPEWTKSVYPDQIHALAARQCEYENFNSALKRLHGGRMLARIIKHMVEKTTDKLIPSGRKMYLYSGHENNVLNILAALDLFQPHVPKYASAVIIELHYVATSGNHAVKIYYLRDLNEEPEEQILKNCNGLCPLNSFIEITKPHIPVNYTAECNSYINLD